MKNICFITAMGLASFAAATAHAESSYVTGTGSAAAKLDIRVIIPRVLFLGVGTGSGVTPLATNGTVDRLTFDYSGNPTAVGNGAAAVASSISNTGGATGAVIPVKVFGNNGQITITATNPANLVAAVATDTIPFTEISAISSNTSLAHPTLGGGTATPTLNTTGSAKVTNQTANWTYAYANSTIPAAGTYDGTITYTAAMP